MARNKERLDIVLNLITDKLRGSARQASAAIRSIGDSAKNTSTPLRSVRTRLSDVSVGAAAIGSAAFIAAQKFRAFAADAVRAASDLVESTNAVEKVFGTAADQVLEFGKVAGQAAGLSNTEFRELSTEIGALLQNFGFTAEEAARETIKLTLRATDMASIFNTDVRQALEAIGSALRQETRPIRRFGVSLSDAEIRARAVADGMANTTAEVTRNQKAFAALDLIYEQTDKTQGDFVDTSDQLANALRIQQAEAENAKAALGEALLPVIAEGTEVAAVATLEFLSMAESIEKVDFKRLGLFQFATGQWGVAAALIHDLTGNIEGAAGEALAFRDASRLLNETLDDGGRSVEAFDAAVVDLTNKGLRVSTEQILAFMAGARISARALPEAAQRLIEFGEAAGWTAEQIMHVEAAVLSAQDPIDQLSDVGDANELERLGLVAQPAADEIEEFGDAAETAADQVSALDENYRNLREAFLNAADPVRRAVSAMDELAKANETYETLLAESEVGVWTQELADAWLDVQLAELEAQSALDVLEGGYEEAMATLMATSGLARAEIEKILEQFGLFPDEIIVEVDVRSNISAVLQEIADKTVQFNAQIPNTPYAPVNPDAGFQVSTGNNIPISNSASTTIVFNGDVVSDDITGDVTTAMTVASIANSRVF